MFPVLSEQCDFTRNSLGWICSECEFQTPPFEKKPHRNCSKKKRLDSQDLISTTKKVLSTVLKKENEHFGWDVRRAWAGSPPHRDWKIVEAILQRCEDLNVWPKGCCNAIRSFCLDVVTVGTWRAEWGEPKLD